MNLTSVLLRWIDTTQMARGGVTQPMDRSREPIVPYQANADKIIISHCQGNACFPSVKNWLKFFNRGREVNSARRRRSEAVAPVDVMHRYCDLVGKIENSSRSFGKDGKFQQFICLALRERILHSLLPSLAASRPTLEMYEEHSFLRDRSLRTFLVEILESLSLYDFSLESSITSGID